MIADVVLNVLAGVIGVLIGWCLFKLVDKIEQLEKRQKAVEESYTRFLETLKNLLMQKIITPDKEGKEDPEALKTATEESSEEKKEFSEEPAKCNKAE